MYLFSGKYNNYWRNERCLHGIIKASAASMCVTGSAVFHVLKLLAEALLKDKEEGNEL